MFDQKFKALTFSFDDGNLDDIRLVGVLNKYGLKSTFNLNSGDLSQGDGWMHNGVKPVTHVNYFDYPNLYDGHEIACHSYTHPHLERLDRRSIDNQIRMDKKLLEYLYGYPMRGMAYPFGTYNSTVVEVLAENKIEYARTIESTHQFDLPEVLLEWNPTCHFRDPAVWQLAGQFVNADAETDMLFYIWGHSYELVTEEDWEKFEEFCKFVSNRDDICYCTNIEVVDHMQRCR